MKYLNYLQKSILLLGIMYLCDTLGAQESFSSLFTGTQINLPGQPDTSYDHPIPLIDLSKSSYLKQTTTDDARIKWKKQNGKGLLQISLGNKSEHPTVTLPFNCGVDLSKHVAIALDIKNTGEKSLAIEGYCFSDTAPFTITDGVPFYYRSIIVLKAGETETMLINLSRAMDSLPDYMRQHFKGMFGLPGGFLRRKVNLDLEQINHLSLFVQQANEVRKVEVSNVRAVGDYNLPDEETLRTRFFPFVDSFGQYKHSDWPGKVKQVEDLYKQRIEEEADLKTHPQPKGLNKYGGWEAGPQLEATGHFRVQKYNGKWWLVDPLGRLFWSHGINQVTLSQVTHIEGRENYYEYLPPHDDFYWSNITMKYQGAPYLTDIMTEQTNRRLKSWGLNTVATHSDDRFYQEASIPYAIEIRSGIPGYIPDDFDVVKFKESLRKTLIERYRIELSANDPMCIGYFVDNEYGWPQKNAKELTYAYFRAIRELLDELAPNKLYLGCRSNSVNFNRIAFEASAQYCDVVSINHYDFNLCDFKGTEGLDCPLIVGEFHFGALDRGLPHSGLRSVPTQKQRARVYEHFIRQALKSEHVVGTHWFQYVDQMYTGRFDGENYQIGFIDVCDKPHKEMIDISREIAKDMYEYRLNQTDNEQ